MDIVTGKYMIEISDVQLLTFLRTTIPVCFMFFIASFAAIMVKLDIWAEHNKNYTIEYIWQVIKTRVYMTYMYLACILVSVFLYIYLTTK